MNKKVFKIKKISMKKDEIIEITKKQSFKVMTTKKLYSGEYSLIIQINGQEYGLNKFFITV